MTTFTTFTDRQHVPQLLSNTPVVAQFVCDLSLLSSAPVVDDVVQLLKIPDNSIVTDLVIAIITADTTATDIDIGITGVDANGFDDAITMANAVNAANTQGVFSPTSGTDAFANGYVNINGDDTIDALIQTADATGDGKLYIQATIQGLSPVSLG